MKSKDSVEATYKGKVRGPSYIYVATRFKGNLPIDNDVNHYLLWEHK